MAQLFVSDLHLEDSRPDITRARTELGWEPQYRDLLGEK